MVYESELERAELSKLEAGDWSEVVDRSKDVLRRCFAQVKAERENGASVYPAAGFHLEALRRTPMKTIRVVIVGQDCYHGSEGGIPQANGLAFSVPNGIRVPPSLRNIIKEVGEDVGMVASGGHDISRWCDQGVLLLNSHLSVREGQPASHAKFGWEEFTDKVISEISANRRDVVFLLWGRHAIRKQSLIDSHRHHIIRTSHPSPLGAHKSGMGYVAFLGSRCFSMTNSILMGCSTPPINWRDL